MFCYSNFTMRYRKAIRLRQCICLLVVISPSKPNPNHAAYFEWHVIKAFYGLLGADNSD